VLFGSAAEPVINNLETIDRLNPWQESQHEFESIFPIFPNLRNRISISCGNKNLFSVCRNPAALRFGKSKGDLTMPCTGMVYSSPSIAADWRHFLSSRQLAAFRLYACS
jgi:hypothetical protein